MQSHTVGFVGGGRITAIFLHALGGRGLALERTTVSDTNGEVRGKLKARFPEITATADNGEAASCARVFLALHPPALKTVLPGVAPRMRKDAVVVSLAPVLTMARLSELLGGFSRLARVLPNAPSLVRAGFNPVAFAEGLPPDARTEIEALLDGLGSTTCSWAPWPCEEARSASASRTSDAAQEIPIRGGYALADVERRPGPGQPAPGLPRVGPRGPPRHPALSRRSPQTA